MTTVINLKTEYRNNPLGIDIKQPRLSWQMDTNRTGAKQTAYRLLCASTPEKLTTDSADLWNSGKIDSDQSVHVRYAGATLMSRQRVYWKVTVWDETGDSSDSDVAWFEMGLLSPDDWKADWIYGMLVGGEETSVPSPYFRKDFWITEQVESARLYITALGLVDCSINGQPVGDDLFVPGWTDYKKRIQYMVYDVSDTLDSGENAIGVLVGDGWAVGQVGLNHRQMYADRPYLLAQLEITLTDGSTQVIMTDDSWTHQYGAMLQADMIHGEAYDARLEFDGWTTSDFNDDEWLPVKVRDEVAGELVATNGPTVKRFEELKPISDPVVHNTLIEKRSIFDLGQNMVGYVRLKGSAPAGTTVTLKFAEVLDEDGNLYTTNLRDARVTDYYTFKGDGEEVWEPKFTFHGFRYVELLGYPGDVSRDTITGIVVHSDMEQTGDFTCSDEMLNQLQHNILWGQKGNFIDVPTDCPQRDERLGWTGDIQVFAETAAYNMDVAGFMTKWMKDVQDAQNEKGMVPAVVPLAIGLVDGGPAWADAVVICPWQMYLAYGDTGILADNYEAMTHFMDYILQVSPGFIRCAPEFEGWSGFGDWLSINAPTPRDLIGTAFLAYDAYLMAQIAEVLGNERDAITYRQLFDDVKEAFGKRFLKGSTVKANDTTPSQMRANLDDADSISQGNLKVVEYQTVDSEVFNTNLFKPTQTSYVLALHFDLLPEDMRQTAADELIADIQLRDGHLSTGFVGSPYLPHVLSENDKLNEAYDLLYQKTWPSWLYAVTQGATTIWERWDGYTEDNGFQDPAMNSFNHYAYGAIGMWLYTKVAGINRDTANPGYKHSIIAPQPGGGLTQATGTIQTLYGELKSSWAQENDTFTLDVTVPPNTTATIQLPTASDSKITLNGEEIDGVEHTVDAGQYQFIVTN